MKGNGRDWKSCNTNGTPKLNKDTTKIFFGKMYPPPKKKKKKQKTNMDTHNDGLEKLPLKMAVTGIYVRFMECISFQVWLFLRYLLGCPPSQ